MNSGARLYDPWAGVWLTREPLPGDAGRPRTWHRYAYVFANPVSYYDPYGRQTCGFDILTGERQCFGEVTGMGWTPTLAAPVVATPILAAPVVESPLAPMAPPPTGASVCPLPLGPADLYTLGYGGYEAWQAGRMLRGGLRFVPGTRYPGQIVVYGTWEARQAAGLSPFLTHARWTHPALQPLLSPGAAGWTQLTSGWTWVGVGLTIAQDVYTYGWGSQREVGLASPEFAAAVTVDVAVTLALPAVGAAVGTAIGGPIGGAAGVAGGSFLAFLFSQNILGLREQSIQTVSGFYEQVLVAVHSASESPVEWEPDWFAWPAIAGP